MYKCNKYNYYNCISAIFEQKQGQMLKWNNYVKLYIFV